MIALVGFEQSKEHLRVTHNKSDNDISLKILQASHIVLDYLKMPEGGPAIPIQAWFWSSPLEVPPLVQAATLLVLGELFENREASVVNVLPQSICDLLVRYRDPAMA